jgi:hypothetical protein
MRKAAGLTMSTPSTAAGVTLINGRAVAWDEPKRRKSFATECPWKVVNSVMTLVRGISALTRSTRHHFRQQQCDVVLADSRQGRLKQAVEQYRGFLASIDANEPP